MLELEDSDIEIDDLPLTPEEALALFRSALGKDECSGMLLCISGGPDSMALLGLAASAKVRGFVEFLENWLAENGVSRTASAAD